MVMQGNAFMLNREDDVAVALTDLGPGAESLFVLDNVPYSVKTTQSIPMYHKLAVHDISKGQIVRKYGEIIGKATSDIKKGDHVHRHNMISVSLYVE